MNMLKKLSITSSLLATLTIPAMAGVNVSNPANGSQVGSNFILNADASTCSAQPVVAMGYSIDSGTDLAIAFNTAVQGSVTSGEGWHTVHVKAWGNRGAVCVSDVSVSVTNSNSVVPAWATSVSNIQNLGSWKEWHDNATQGWSGGSMSVVGAPSRSGNTRKFVTSYIDNGGEIYNASFGDDTSAQNFLYDACVYIESPSDKLANLEMDVNQVTSNGQTVIFGFQCDGWTSTWDYTTNKGTPENPSDQWVHSKAYCNPRSWGKDQWHHVQISYSRDNSGNVCYKSVWLDGNEQDLYATVPSAFALGWAPTMLTNFQMDGNSPGGWSNATVYLDNLTVYRW